jgi:tetratricopeptide (TPR) repeat protein
MKRADIIGVVILCVGAPGLALAVYLHTRSPAPGACPGACDAITGQTPPGVISAAYDTIPPSAPPQPLPLLSDANQIALLMNGAAQRIARWSLSPSLPGPERLAEAAAAFHEALGVSMEQQFYEVKAYIAAGDRAMARLDFQTAASCFQAARLLDPNDLDAAKGLAIALTASARNEEAVATYRDILGRLPEDVTTKYNLAVALAKIGRGGEAEELLAQVVEAQGGFMEAWYNLATLYTADAKLSRAREAWEKVAALAPKMAYPCMKLGEVLMDLEEPNAAILAFVEATKRDPNDASAHMNLAAASVRMGSYGQAVLATERAAALAPGSAGVWSSLGNLRISIYTATGEGKFLRDAVGAWERSLALDPNQDDVKDNLNHFRKDLPAPTTRGSAAR